MDTNNGNGVEIDYQELKQEFQRAEADYIAGLNHREGFTGSARELWQLRTAMEAAQRACDEAGVPVQTVEEWAKEEREKSEQWLRESADRITSQHVVLLRQGRMASAAVMAGGVALWLWLGGNTAAGACLGLLAGPLAYGLLCQFLPTPWMRLGRRAAERGVHLPLWDDARQKEFNDGFDRERRQNKKQWIKVYE